MQEFFHSVTLDKTSAGAASTVSSAVLLRPSGCGTKSPYHRRTVYRLWECIGSAAPRQKSDFDELSVIHRFEYVIALPAPSLMAQFNLEDVDIVLNARL